MSSGQGFDPLLCPASHAWRSAWHAAAAQQPLSGLVSDVGIIVETRVQMREAGLEGTGTTTDEKRAQVCYWHLQPGPSPRRSGPGSGSRDPKACLGPRVSAQPHGNPA